MGKTGNASCSELGDKKASGSELRGLQPSGGSIVVYVLHSVAPRPIGRVLWPPGVDATRTGETFFPPPPGLDDTPSFAQLALGCSNPPFVDFFPDDY